MPNRLLLRWASNALLACCAVLLSCASAERSTEQVMKELERSGLRITDAASERPQMQSEFDNLHEAMATNVPLPKLVRAVRIDDVLTDVFWCPGRSQQARAVVEVLLRGNRDDDPTGLGHAAEVITGYVNLPMEAHIFSLRPTNEQDAQALRIAKALAKLEAK